jgi:hypothetical protein
VSAVTQSTSSSAPAKPAYPSRLQEQSQEPQAAATARASPPQAHSNEAVLAAENKPAPLLPSAAEAQAPMPQQQQEEDEEEAEEDQDEHLPEEKHHQKPQWRRALQAGATAYLSVTVTPSDCTTRRLRPPRESEVRARRPGCSPERILPLTEPHINRRALVRWAAWRRVCQL